MQIIFNFLLQIVVITGFSELYRSVHSRNCPDKYGLPVLSYDQEIPR